MGSTQRNTPSVPQLAQHVDQKLACLDAIRGLAAVVVVLAHIMTVFWPGLMHRDGPQWAELPNPARFLFALPFRRIWDGEMAVSVFFVLSGFVLSLGFFQTGSGAALGSAAVRRYPRLMVPIVASVVLTWFAMQAGALRNRAVADFIHESRGLTYEDSTREGEGFHWLVQRYRHSPELLTDLGAGLGSVFSLREFRLQDYNIVLWTMPFEVIGSFIVFGFLALFGGSRNRWILYLLGGGGAAAYARGVGVDIHWFLGFFLGMAMCDVWTRNQQSVRRSLPLTPAVLLALAGFLVIRDRLIAATLVVGAVTASPRLQQLLSARWLALLGRISFGVYLVHMLVLCTLGCGVYLLFCRDLGWGHHAGSAVAGLVTLLVTFPSGWAFYHLVDRPAIALARRIDVWLFKPRAERSARTTHPLPDVRRVA